MRVRLNRQQIGVAPAVAVRPVIGSGGFGQGDNDRRCGPLAYAGSLIAGMGVGLGGLGGRGEGRGLIGDGFGVTSVTTVTCDAL